MLSVTVGKGPLADRPSMQRSTATVPVGMGFEKRVSDCVCQADEFEGALPAFRHPGHFSTTQISPLHHGNSDYQSVQHTMASNQTGASPAGAAQAAAPQAVAPQAETTQAEALEAEDPQEPLV